VPKKTGTIGKLILFRKSLTWELTLDINGIKKHKVSQKREKSLSKFNNKDQKDLLFPSSVKPWNGFRL
jgi:hypothetical protein